MQKINENLKKHYKWLMPIGIFVLVMTLGTIAYFTVPPVHKTLDHLAHRSKVNTAYLLNIRHKAVITEKEPIPYETVYKDDPTLEIGETHDAWATGHDGERTITFEVTYRGEKEISRREVSNGITKEADPHLIYRGTKPEQIYVDNSYSNFTPTAVCNDGTYSYSANSRGTCSYHGGVDYWY